MNSAQARSLAIAVSNVALARTKTSEIGADSAAWHYLDSTEHDLKNLLLEIFAPPESTEGMTESETDGY